LQINSCNGMRCGETFAGPNSPNKPSIWTEDWTSLYVFNEMLSLFFFFPISDSTLNIRKNSKWIMSNGELNGIDK
jgi:hypothetical protein